MQDELSANSELNSTLQNVLMETNDTVDGLLKYRAVIKGIKGNKFLKFSMKNGANVEMRRRK